MRCFTVELRETEIDALVHRGLLNVAERSNRGSILKAFYVFLDRTLGVQQ